MLYRLHCPLPSDSAAYSNIMSFGRVADANLAPPLPTDYGNHELTQAGEARLSGLYVDEVVVGGGEEDIAGLSGCVRVSTVAHHLSASMRLFVCQEMYHCFLYIHNVEYFLCSFSLFHRRFCCHCRPCDKSVYMYCYGYS